MKMMMMRTSLTRQQPAWIGVTWRMRTRYPHKDPSCSMQGEARTEEPGLPLGSVGAGGSSVTLGVPAEDRWMGGDESMAAPKVLVEGVALMRRPLSRRRGWLYCRAP